MTQFLNNYRYTALPKNMLKWYLHVHFSYSLFWLFMFEVDIMKIHETNARATNVRQQLREIYTKLN